MLIEIDDDNRELAIRLLSEGMPRVTEDKWRANLDRISAYGGNSAIGIPAGILLMVDGNCEGVMLTLADTRTEPSGERRTIVNLSSWYITPEQRWRAPLMMRRIMRLPASVITDLTPTASVQQMLVALGFQQLNAGESLVALPLSAVSGRQPSTVHDLGKGARVIVDPELHRLMEKHLAFGCIGAALETKGGIVPLLFRSQSVKGLPVARLIYCEDNDALITHLGAVSRFLLGKRQLLLRFDVPLAKPVPGIKRPASGKKFASKALPAGKTDYAGSELGLFAF